MRKYIFLDTNNWIYLSNGFNILSNKHDELHLKIFDIIRNRVEEGSLVFLINSIVISEWDRNKHETKRQIEIIQKKYKGYIANLKSVKEFINSDSEELARLKIILERKFIEKIERHQEHIKSVEDFLINKTLKIGISDRNKIEASDLALDKKAPFIGDKRNSMADALILLSSLEHIYKNEKISFPTEIDINDEQFHFPESYFVSSNKGDFSALEDKESIHPDLKPYLERTNTKFYFTLGKLINSLEARLLTEEEENIIEHIDESAFCDICDYDYYPSVNFSEYFEIYNPNKEYTDKNQLNIEFSEHKQNNKVKKELSTPFSKIRTADCSNCGADFIECTCGALNHIDDYNYTFECIGGCGNKFRITTDIDRKGMIHGIEYEIIQDFRCSICGENYESIDKNGLCETCAEYERISINE